LTQEFPQAALGSALPVLSVLPFGVSFYTFAAISYIVDVYKRRINPIRNFIDLGFFLSFFPVAAAGPVLRAADFIPQLRKFYQVTSREFSAALLLILGGLVKIAVANFIVLHLDLKSWISIYGYAAQIYCIFSGYTAIAIGVAMLLGFNIPQNFNSPYKATSIVAFCNRWYISFFLWLRDYIYIPLGGRKKRQDVSVKKNSSWIRFVGFLLTFNVICFMWMILRADTFDNAILTVQQLFIPVTLTEITNNAVALSLAAVVLILHFLPQRTKNSCREIFYNLPIVIKFLITLAVVAVIYLRF
jgi:D-alanyl-lipoteichoic acid acyltransferase DltB (MBOAT superfamily)